MPAKSSAACSRARPRVTNTNRDSPVVVGLPRVRSECARRDDWPPAFRDRDARFAGDRIRGHALGEQGASGPRWARSEFALRTEPIGGGLGRVFPFLHLLAAAPTEPAQPDERAAEKRQRGRLGDRLQHSIQAELPVSARSDRDDFSQRIWRREDVRTLRVRERERGAARRQRAQRNPRTEKGVGQIKKALQLSRGPPGIPTAREDGRPLRQPRRREQARFRQLDCQCSGRRRRDV